MCLEPSVCTVSFQLLLIAAASWLWAAGRDGKEFLKALRSENRKRVHCFVDVDGKKIDAGHYMNREIGLKIPILHFSYLVRDDMLRERLTKDWRNGSE